MLQVLARTRFEAARRLPLAAGAAKARLHGHGFQLDLRASAGGGAFAGDEVGHWSRAVMAASAPLDHQFLNEVLPVTDDLDLARHFAVALGARACRISSTPVHAAWAGEDGAARVCRRYRFEAAHRLPGVPPGHKCGRMHGHGFAVTLGVDEAGSGAAGHARLDAAWAPLQARLDHCCLNELPGLENPTSEMLAQWIWTQLEPGLAGLRGVTVHETRSCGAHFDGKVLGIWKDVDLDSAIVLEAAPAGDTRARLHGHSYRLRLHLQGPLDTVRGWVLDFGDVKERFAPVFARLDHHPLHELPGIAAGGTVALAHWIARHAQPELPDLAGLDLFETPGSGVRLELQPGALA
jgi:6-pyruvoyltetrahydropterin/6-carboxytetrahydropterin synthase